MRDLYGFPANNSNFPPGVTEADVNEHFADGPPDELMTTQEILDSEPIEYLGNSRILFRMRPCDFDELEPSAVHAWIQMTFGRNGPVTWKRVEMLDKQFRTCIQIQRTPAKEELA